jgi:hypothetical protein
MEELPFALLKPKRVEARTHLYTYYPNPEPLTATNQNLRKQLAPFLDGELVVIDLETEGLRPAGTKGACLKVGAVSLANVSAVSSWSLRGGAGQQLWRQLLEILAHRKTPLVAHNLVFDLSWMLRDLNMDGQGRLPRWVNEWRRLNIRYCTLGLFRQLASEGFINQIYSLAFAQEYFLRWEASNKKERNRRLFENGIIRKDVPRMLGEKLMGVEGYAEYVRRYSDKIPVGESVGGGDEEDIEDC